MGRRKIEIKAIKDDRNRSVTFLKRKGGLFKKAHELSVLCSVDVAVFIFGTNKKLYEYSSSDMGNLIGRYQYHGPPQEHKGPSDFSGGNDDDDDDEVDATPPRGHSVPIHDGMEPMMHPHFPHGPQFGPPHMRHHTASPPIGHGVFHPGQHPQQRSHTPQPSNLSRPSSRNDIRRMTPGPPGMPQPGPHQGPHPGITYMPTPPIYTPPTAPQAPMMQQPGPYGFQHPPPQHPQQHPQQPPHSQQQHPQQPPHVYMEEHRPQPPPPPTYTSQPPQPGIQVTSRPDPSPPHPPHQQIPQVVHHMSPPPPHFQQPPLPQQSSERNSVGPQPQEKTDEAPVKPPLLNTDSAIRKLNPRNRGSIFTPIEAPGSILSTLGSFTDSRPEPTSNGNGDRARSVDPTTISRNGASTSSPPRVQRPSPPSNLRKMRTASESSAADEGFTPPSRSNSFTKGATRTRGPRLTVQIPDEGSEPGSATAATNDSNSPKTQTETTQSIPQRLNNPASAVVLPPPSPSASALLSAGATGPPNPFARPPPTQNVIETPASALPSRFLNTEFLPSPSSFYQDWSFRGDSNTLPSPLINFATPVVGSGPSFLREEATSQPTSNAPTTAPAKRKTPDYANGDGDGPELTEAKRVKVDA